MEKITTDKLLISSDFYSVQGEGISTGIPSYFVRLANCNLTCGMSRLFTNKLMKEKTLEDGEIFIGDLEQEGKATWTCDSTSQWLYRGVNQDFQYLIDRWKEQGIYEDIKNDNIFYCFKKNILILHSKIFFKTLISTEYTKNQSNNSWF
jgi:organic radical activating enzyme